MATPLVLVWTALAIVGWRFVRGHGQGPRLLVWLTFVLGPFGVLIWWSVRRGARLGAEAAEADAQP